MDGSRNISGSGRGASREAEGFLLERRPKGLSNDTYHTWNHIPADTYVRYRALFLPRSFLPSLPPIRPREGAAFRPRRPANTFSRLASRADAIGRELITISNRRSDHGGSHHGPPMSSPGRRLSISIASRAIVASRRDVAS